MPNDLSIYKIRFKSTVLIKSWSDTIENTISIISSHFELQSLPKVGAFLIQKNMYIAALSPGHYMIISDHQDLYLKLSKILLSENAAVIDISESRRGLHLKGADAPLILNKEIAIDLSNKTTSDFAVIQSEIHSIGVIVFKLSAEDFLIFSYSSLFESFYEWIIDAKKEYE
jgi:heterotetrameric sarcosine oxidase gamma subunit